MPFIKKINKQGLQPQADAKPLFIGRTSELLFFKQYILKPEDPTYNIISIYGQGGVGKSTLVARLIGETCAPKFKDWCLTALVDERQITPVSIMERFADQLHMSGRFLKALTDFKETLRKLQTHQETTQGTISHKLPNFTGAAVEGFPIIGPFLRESVKETTGYLLEEYHNIQARRGEERLEDPIGNLTKAFISELNSLADDKVISISYQAKRERRIILFFDTFEQLAAEVVPWLLDHFLEAEINSNVVLVVAGRDPIEHSTPNNVKRWLKYQDSGLIYTISLDCFTEEETRTYLTKRDITDPDRIDTIWQLSRGLPLYLGLLTSNTQGKVDPTKDVVDNFLCWIPEQEQVKRRLVLEASLLSKSFNQDDLEAFTYLSESERPSYFRWLVGQPFVRSSPEDGLYTYHELAQGLFSRHLYQRSHIEYYAARRALADHYQGLLEKIELVGSKGVYRSSEWLELSLALAYQRFFLPDEVSQWKAIEQAFYIYKHAQKEQQEEIIRVLRKLSQEQSTKQASSKARRYAKLILQFMETNQDSQEFIDVASSLLEEFIQRSSFSTELVAFFYRKRGNTYQELKKYPQAIVDYGRALELDPNDATTYSDRGSAYYWHNEYQQALSDFNRVLELNPNSAAFYNWRGWTYYRLKEYQKALSDFNQALELDPDHASAYEGRGWIFSYFKQYQQASSDFDRLVDLQKWGYVSRGSFHRKFKQYQQAIADYGRALELDPNDANAYIGRGRAYSQLKEYQQAIADFDHALKLDPDKTLAYEGRGWVYYSLKEYQQALEEFDHAIKLAPHNTTAYEGRGWVYYSLKEYQRASADFDRLVEIAAWGHVSRGNFYSQLKEYQRAIADFDRALKLNPNDTDIYSSRGWAYLWLKNIKQAKADFTRSCELDASLIRNRWIIIWTEMCQNRPDLSTVEQLRRIATIDSQHYNACVCRGTAEYLNKRYEQTLAELEQAIQLESNKMDAYFWKGMACASLKKDTDAIVLIEKALELDLPPILLTPLCWFEQDRSDFYEKHLKPLLDRYE